MAWQSPETRLLSSGTEVSEDTPSPPARILAPGQAQEGNGVFKQVKAGLYSVTRAQAFGGLRAMHIVFACTYSQF